VSPSRAPNHHFRTWRRLKNFSPSRAAKILGTVSLALATFMNVLDTSIANVSLSVTPIRSEIPR
jgi:hypothetical protein